MYFEITRCETVQQHRTANWGESDLAAFKAKCQRRAENDNYYANIFAAIKDMSMGDILAEYDKWGSNAGECMLINAGASNIPLGAVIDDEFTTTVMEAEVVEDSVEDVVHHIKIRE